VVRNLSEDRESVVVEALLPARCCSRPRRRSSPSGDGAQKFAERGLNVIVPAGVVDLAYLSDLPSAGVRILETGGVEVHAV
jgi:hypothetical protein